MTESRLILCMTPLPQKKKKKKTTPSRGDGADGDGEVKGRRDGAKKGKGARVGDDAADEGKKKRGADGGKRSSDVKEATKDGPTGKNLGKRRRAKVRTQYRRLLTALHNHSVSSEPCPLRSRCCCRGTGTVT